MSAEAVHIVVHGRVQGVFFRASAQARARELNLTGWVKNRADGMVEIHAEGEKKDLDLFAEWCRKGPPVARVENLDLERASPQGFNDFDVR